MKKAAECASTWEGKCEGEQEGVKAHGVDYIKKAVVWGEGAQACD